MVSITTAFLAAISASLVSAHMSMSSPLAFGSKELLSKVQGGESYINYSLTSPLSKNTFPCNVANFQAYIAGPGAEPVATWAAGSQQSFTIQGGASHNGGSCQAVFSEDNGVTWKVAQNYIGNCPVAGKQYTLTVPKETKSGKVLFGWTWFNNTGQREMYMNCAAIQITGGGSGLADKPDMFTAHVEGLFDECKIPEGLDATFNGCKGQKPGAAAPDGESGQNTTPTEPTTPEQPAPVLPGESAPAVTASNKPSPDTPTSTPDAPAYTPSAPAPKPKPTSPPAPKPKQPKPTSPPAPITTPDNSTTYPTKPEAPGTPAGGCMEGTFTCSADGNTFSICDHGELINMGKVSPGTKCVDGKIAKRSLLKLRAHARDLKFHH